MRIAIDGILLLLLLTNLVQLGSSRLRVCIQMLAVQGIALSFLPFVIESDYLSWHALFLALPALFLRGIIFPWLLLRVLQGAGIRREVEPYVGFRVSLLLGIVAMAVAMHLSSVLVLPVSISSPHVMPVSFLSMFVGLFLIITRRKALSQVAGYLVMENGIYAFGVAVAVQNPWLIELGVLLDLLVAVFIMGIAMFHINREFDHIDVDRLDNLHDHHTPLERRNAINTMREN